MGSDQTFRAVVKDEVLEMEEARNEPKTILTTNVALSAETKRDIKETPSLCISGNDNRIPKMDCKICLERVRGEEERRTRDWSKATAIYRPSTQLTTHNLLLVASLFAPSLLAPSLSSTCSRMQVEEHEQVMRCACRGSLGTTLNTCLLRWVQMSQSTACRECGEEVRGGGEGEWTS